MEKLHLGTQDGVDQNIERLGELFPQVVTEVQGEDGKTRRAVDFDALRDLLGDVAEGQRERYQFTWPGKAEAKAEARRPIAKTMRPQKEKSVNWDTTQNLYIEGDNLDALKILKETYAGQVKLIYIDPPYNTGHDFVYDDDFAKTRGEYDAESGDYDDEGGRLVANTEGNGRFHSDWCSMMYPRLMLARDLLTDDGVIVVSIDDNEVRNLRNLCDDVFGEANFIASFVWQKRTSPDMRRIVSAAHEYLVVYAKDVSNRDCVSQIPYDENDMKRYKNPDNDPNGPWISTDCTAQAGHGTPAQFYDMVTPSGRVVPLGSGLCWRYTEKKMKEEIAAGHIWFGADGNGVPRKKTYLKDMSGKNAWTWLPHSDVGHTQEATKELKALFDGLLPFDFPKPTRLLLKILQITAKPGALVLDLFSGSAALADSILKYNAAYKKEIRYIAVQLPEATPDKSPAKAAGFRTIDAVGEERIRRAGAKIAAEVEEANRQLKIGEEPKPVPDLGFRVLSIDSSNMRDTLAPPEETTQASLFGLADNVKDGRSDMDLLFEVLPKFRIPYSAGIEEVELGGKRCFDVNGGQLIACFDAQVGTATIEEIAKRGPDYAVMRDASMADDATQANFEELFRAYSPDTVRRVI